MKHEKRPRGRLMPYHEVIREMQLEGKGYRTICRELATYGLVVTPKAVSNYLIKWRESGRSAIWEGLALGIGRFQVREVEVARVVGVAEVAKVAITPKMTGKGKAKVTGGGVPTGVRSGVQSGVLSGVQNGVPTGVPKVQSTPIPAPVIAVPSAEGMSLGAQKREEYRQRIVESQARYLEEKAKVPKEGYGWLGWNFTKSLERDRIRAKKCEGFDIGELGETGYRVIEGLEGVDASNEIQESFGNWRGGHFGRRRGLMS